MQGSDAVANAEQLREALALLAEWGYLRELTIHGGFALREFHGGVRPAQDLDLRFDGRVDQDLVGSLCRRIKREGGNCPRGCCDAEGLRAGIKVSAEAGDHYVQVDLAAGRRAGWEAASLRFGGREVPCRVSPAAAIVSGQALTLSRHHKKGKDVSKDVWDIAFHTRKEPLDIVAEEINWRMERYGGKLNATELVQDLSQDEKLHFRVWMKRSCLDPARTLLQPRDDGERAPRARVPAASGDGA